MCLIQFLHPSLFFSSSWPSLRFWIALLLAGNPSQATHHVFSSFDTCVQKLNLFKMDTVGDAYIVAAWLTHEDDHDVRALSKMCHDILELAHCMLQTIEQYRSKGGYGISALGQRRGSRAVISCTHQCELHTHPPHAPIHTP